MIRNIHRLYKVLLKLRLCKFGRKADIIESQSTATPLWELESGRAVPQDVGPCRARNRAEAQHVASSFQLMGRPGKIQTAQESFRVIQGSDDYEVERADLCSLDIACLSVPPPGFRPISMTSLLGPEGP